MLRLRSCCAVLVVVALGGLSVAQPGPLPEIEREPSIDELMPIASMGGRYTRLLRVLYAPGDRARYGELNELGALSRTEYGGYKDLPLALWTYVSPYWFLWDKQVAVAQWAAANAIGVPAQGKSLGDAAWSPADGMPHYLTCAFRRPVHATAIVIRMTRPESLAKLEIQLGGRAMKTIPTQFADALPKALVTRVVAVPTEFTHAVRLLVPQFALENRIAVDSVGLLDAAGRMHWAIRASAKPARDPEAAAAVAAVAKESAKALPDGNKAIQRGLDWLARHQAPDGSWRGHDFDEHCKESVCSGKGLGEYNVGTTALSVLAFLGAGHTMSVGPHRERVRRGIEFLRRTQSAEGCFGVQSGHFMYSHAIATLAMAEAYAFTGSTPVRRSAERGVKFLLDAQNNHPSGRGKFAWRYTVMPGDNDTSITSWAILALKSAQNAGLAVPQEALEGGRRFVGKMVDESSGRIGYIQPGVSPVRAPGREEAWPRSKSEAITAAGILTLLNTGDEVAAPRIQRAARLLQAKPPLAAKDGRIDHYYWYQGTLAMYQIGGQAWKTWHTALKIAVLGSQRTDGCARGSWDPDGPWGAEGGRVYSTALMTMCLEASYRYGRVAGGK